MKRYLVVGAGFTGAVIARELAEKQCARVHVIDARSHIGGNCHTERDAATSVMVHTYGPHIFNTDLQHVWEYVNRYGNMCAFTNRVKASTTQGVFSMPINLHTINQFYGKTFSPNEARLFIESKGDTSIIQPKNFEEQALKFIGVDLYEAFFKGYTQKQWGCAPSELPASILKRLPVRFNYNDNYYNTLYQGIPRNGYTDIIKNILDHKNITVELASRYRLGDEAPYDHLVYTGTIDGYFNYCYGRLRYRTVKFERLDGKDDIQGNAVINYPGFEVKYTRIHEHKYFTPWERHDRTVAFKEYSNETSDKDDPYYPLRLDDDIKLLQKYILKVNSLNKITFAGRLGTYRYLDMDDVIDEALSCASEFIRDTNRINMAVFQSSPELK